MTANDHWEFGAKVVELFRTGTPEHQQGHHAVRPEPEEKEPEEQPDDYPCGGRYCRTGTRVERRGGLCPECGERNLAAVGIKGKIFKRSTESKTDTDALRRRQIKAQREWRKWERENGFR